MLGATLCWLAYRQHFDATDDAAAQLAVFSTAPAIRNPLWNVVTEAIGTFVLVFIIIQFGNTPGELGPLAVALLGLAEAIWPMRKISPPPQAPPPT